MLHSAQAEKLHGQTACKELPARANRRCPGAKAGGVTYFSQQSGDTGEAPAKTGESENCMFNKNLASAAGFDEGLATSTNTYLFTELGYEFFCKVLREEKDSDDEYCYHLSNGSWASESDAEKIKTVKTWDSCPTLEVCEEMRAKGFLFVPDFEAHGLKREDYIIEYLLDY